MKECELIKSGHTFGLLAARWTISDIFPLMNNLSVNDLLLWTVPFLRFICYRNVNFVLSEK